jgi:hypothetical protein
VLLLVVVVGCWAEPSGSTSPIRAHHTTTTTTTAAVAPHSVGGAAAATMLLEVGIDSILSMLALMCCRGLGGVLPCSWLALLLSIAGR